VKEFFGYLECVKLHGWQDEEMDIRMLVTAIALMQTLQYSVSVVMKRELSNEENLSVFVLILTYGHESRVLPKKKIAIKLLASELRFLRRIEGATVIWQST